MLTYELEAMASGHRLIAGVDEAGRGPLAGPVAAAAVILPCDADLPGCDDSKKLAEKKREKLYQIIFDKAVAVSFFLIEADQIDQTDILQATKLAMKKAVEGLSTKPDCLLIDGNHKIDWPGAQNTIVKGDSKSLSIAAASIIAKVTRDRLMKEYAGLYPGYGFERHKGYGVKEHLAAIKKLGPTPIHRKSFKGVKEFCVEPDLGKAQLTIRPD